MTRASPVSTPTVAEYAPLAEHIKAGRLRAITSTCEDRALMNIGRSHAGISLRSFRHLAGTETGRQISELMDNDIRLSM